ncbi:hypothetical protein ATO6_18095 [Oceanicola sp. 22II-s10i]|uniref:response regulator n=1 Tax=Oceanicola sp. 22II-s10i TaxID=1317116 RepID=UPI000B527849|nr:response regulator [Oceanicola sp. 22II-s10i]OWU83380.1 hypothetical protein ATO6_18095 [Oceanicola sp. 22II-s10i]
MTRRPRILVVEDEFLYAALLKRILSDAGFEVVGPHATVDAAIAEIAAANSGLDGATLDLSLAGGQTSGPVAQALWDRGIPFLFLTGDDSILDASAAPMSPRPVVLVKPVPVARVVREVQSMVTPPHV